MGLRWVDLGRQFGLAAVAALVLSACGETADENGGFSGVTGAVGGVGGAGGASGMAAGIGGMGAGAGGMAGVAAGGTGGGVAPSSGMPCEVETVVKARCQGCHGAMRVGGAPISLLTQADFQQDYTVASTMQLKGQVMKVHQLVKIRINEEMGTSIMPQGAPMAAEELTMFNEWLTQGAPAGAACATNPVAGSGGGGGMGGGAGGTGGDSTNLCDASEAYMPLVARDGETCWEFLTHDGDGVTPFQVPTDESYNQLYYDVPWPEGHIATRFGAKFDNLDVLHHWLGFETDENLPHNHVAKLVTGSTGGPLGGGYESKLFGGWAVGGCNVEFPTDMGLELPGPSSGKKIMVQWHHYNFTNQIQPDSSVIQVCTVPAGARPNVGGLTWLGTEELGNFIIPGDGLMPGMESKREGTCLNETAAPITIVAFWPHMHEIGTHMYTEVIRAAGGVDTVFDKPFKFDYQVHYDLDPYVVLQPGDKIRAQCTFTNTTAGEVDFGQSTDQEMCYQFAFSYPAGALDKGNPSLIGATNTCWGD